LPDARGLPFLPAAQSTTTFFSIEEVLTPPTTLVEYPLFTGSRKNRAGIEKRTLLIGEREHGHDVLILKESLGRELKSLGRAADYAGNTPATNPVPREFKRISTAEIHEMLNKKKAARVMLITRPLVIDNQLVLVTKANCTERHTAVHHPFSGPQQAGKLSGAPCATPAPPTRFRGPRVEEEIRVPEKRPCRPTVKTEMARASQRAVELEKAGIGTPLRITVGLYTEIACRHHPRRRRSDNL
jgi:hypothetical protein